MATNQYDNIIKEASKKYGVDANLIKAVIQQESGFRNYVGSSAGAQGLMQLMPATAKSLGVTNIYDPNQNIMAGTKYLAQQIKSFGSVELGLAAYNAGPGNVSKYGGVPPFEETKNYVKKIMSQYQGGGLIDGGSTTDESSSNSQENVTGTSTIIHGVLRTVFLVMLLVVAIIFFRKAFPVSTDMLDLVNPVSKVKAVKKVLK